ncbi:MAG TPA: hypothetical protein VI248_05690 [Kineosporiaceae bacterium]
MRRRDAQLGDLLVELGGYLVAGAQLLSEVLTAEQTERASTASRLREVDHAAEAAGHGVMRLLSAAFVTPFDRADVYRVSWAMRACVGWMEAAADDIALFAVGPVPTGVIELVFLVVRAADVTVQALPRLTHASELSDSWIELSRMGKQAGQSHRRLLADVTATPTDPATLIRLVTVAQSLRRVVEAFEEIANALQTVAVKEG